jgi:hypothetical protein
VRGELQQAKLPVRMYERESADTEHATLSLGAEGNLSNPEIVASVDDQWWGAGVCGCRSPLYLAFQIPEQHTQREVTSLRSTKFTIGLADKVKD